MKTEDKIRELIIKSDAKTAAEADNRILAGALEHLEKLREKNLAAGGAGVWRIIVKSPIAKLAAAAVIVIAALIGVHQISAPGIAWADVTERFRSVPFFSVAIYIKEDAASEPKQMELWMSGDGRSRLRCGQQVIFAKPGIIPQAFDIKTRSRIEPDEMAAFLLKRIGEADEFSLEAIIKVMFRSEMQDVTPLVNPDAVISQDIVVFDVELPNTPEWVRIWALRESRLPVRIKIWDPRDGDFTDAIFEYSREQADEFFDPSAFEQLMLGSQAVSRTNIAYAYLKDPGGKQITPEDMFAQAGYHMPIIKHAGITPDGAVWVIADKGYNRTPTGVPIYGFSKIEDDLGREYRKVYFSHRTATDQSMDVFVPIDYPFDKRSPKKITLTCQNKYAMRPDQDLVGTVDLTEWQQGRLWPEDTINSGEQQLAITLAWQHCNTQQNDKVERILETIQGEPEDSPAALDREKIHLRMLLSRDKTDEALALAERLMPLLEKKYWNWKGLAPTPSVSVFTDCILALAYAGKMDEVKQTWQRIKSIKTRINPELTRADRTAIEENIQRGFDECLRVIVPEVSSKAHLTVEQLGDIFDIDVTKNEVFKNYVFWDWNPEFEKPKYKNWVRHLSELAEHYKSHPLPESMELLEHKKKEEYAARLLKMPGIEDYLVELFHGPLKNYACFYNFPESVGRLRMEDDIPDIELGHDLIYKDGINQQQRIRFLLDQFGLEIVEVNEPRTVWIARHDGRELKDPGQVRAPVPLDASGKIKTGMMSSSASAGLDFEYLFRNFMYWQNRDYKADCIIIVDETKITGPVSCEGPQWEGPEAPEMARKWFEDEMGVTFTEETRQMKTYVVRTRKKG